MLRVIRQYFTNMKSIPKQLTYRQDYYNSIHFQATSQISSENLRLCIEEALNQNKKAIWIHLHTTNLKHISLLVNDYKFKIHHGLGQKVVLYRWMSELSDLVSPYSMFYVSCGAIIIKDDRLFLVEEKNGPRQGQFGIPGGRADIGQTLSQCAQRQLVQQTGIKAKYKHILYIRQLQNTVFNGGDIYFACYMQNPSNNLSQIKLCTRQLNSYQWVHLNQVGEWMQTRSRGTQLLLAKYLQKLYQNGYKFEERIPNLTKEGENVSIRDQIKRKFVEHMLVEIGGEGGKDQQYTGKINKL